jgi:methionine synthase II (cobalamin-independent)
MFKANCKATAIGSFPHDSAGGALALIRECLPDIPVWPQLPKLGYFEGMIPQYSEGIPGVILDPAERKIRVDTSGDFMKLVEKFYEAWLLEDPARFAISREYTAGFYAFMDGFGAGGPAAVKGHVTGPVTWGLTVPDENGRASYYNDHLKDCIVKCIARKAQWQIGLLKKVAPEVIIFVDEPYLQSIGSSTVALQRDEVKERLDEVFGAIEEAGGIPGIHICGNSDWGLISQTKTRVINFDAYEFGESISLYPGEMSDYIECGGIVAWGIVPSSAKVADESADSLAAKFRETIGLLARHGIPGEKLLESSLVTPSCGVGSLSMELAERAIRLTGEVSKILRGA